MPGFRTLLAIVAVALASILAVPSAGAKVVEKEHFSFTESHIEQEEHGPDFCQNVDFLVLFEGKIRGFTLIKTKGSGPFPYFAETHRFDETYTNLENGKSLRIVTRGRSADQRIVDNGDGTITLTVKDTGVRRIIGPDGQRLVESGQFAARIVIDYNGTPSDPEDDTLLSFEDIKQTGRNDLAELDFCDLLVTFLG